MKTCDFKRFTLQFSLFFCLLFFIFYFALPAFAQTSGGGTVTVSATVPTTVSATKSSLITDVQTVPADGSSRATLTATLVDDSNNPVPNASVKITSNRGSVDTILCYQGSTLTSSNTTTADSNGIAKCVVSSTAPGQATFSAFVDDQLTLNDKPLVTFTALPVLQNLTVTVSLGTKSFTIFKPAPKPSTPTPTPTVGTEPSHQSGTGQLVNTGINVQLSIWTFLLIIVGLLTIPVLFLIIIWLILVIRKMLLAERDIHTKEQQSIDQLAEAEKQIAARTTQIAATTNDIEQSLPEPALTEAHLPGDQPPIED